MKLAFVKVLEVGLIEERVVFVANEDCDIGRFMMFSSVYLSVGEKRISSRITNPFWFPDLFVKRGDHVIVYTKKGSYKQKLNSDGSTSHFYYRGIAGSSFTGENPCVVVVDIADWHANEVNKKTEPPKV